MREPRTTGIRARLADRVHAQLLDDIAEGRWSGDKFVSAYGLARRLGVSRTPVMEALKRLEGEGLIEILPRVGARLRSTTAEASDELLAIVGALLGLAAERAALRVDEAWLERLEMIADELDRAVADHDIPRYRQAGAQAYLSLLRLGLPAHLSAIEPLWRLMRAEALRDLGAVITARRAADIRALIEALRTRSPLRARAATEKYVADGAARLRGGSHPEGPEAKLEHSAVLYRSPGELLGEALPLALEGLRRDEAVLVVSSQVNLETLGAALGSDAARIDLRDSARWYDDPAATLRRYRHYIDEHRSSARVRIIGEPPWRGRDDAQTEDWLRYESVINVALESAPASIMCLYDAATLPPQILAGARAGHPRVSESGHTGVSPHYSGFFSASAL